jgi:uncharacterized repeat protein (TIGR03843 family)
VYKPVLGEQPLWDFPQGTLAAREVAAYLTSQALGWDLVPPTVLRRDGPAGGGSLQLYVPADLNHHYFTFSDAERERLRPVVVFDLLINNADRKAGHVLLDAEGRIRLIDHGVCFHVQDKLRTVIWDFVGQPIPEDLRADAASFGDRLRSDQDLRARFAPLLSPDEIDALISRADRLLRLERFPPPGPHRPYPWPAV